MYHLSVNSDIMLIMFVVPVWLLSVEQFNLLSFRYFHSFTNISVYSFISGQYFHLIFCLLHNTHNSANKYKLDLLSLILTAICLVVQCPSYRCHRVPDITLPLELKFYALCIVGWVEPSLPYVVWCGVVCCSGVHRCDLLLGQPGTS
jgi:hypothetical protein